VLSGCREQSTQNKQLLMAGSTSMVALVSALAEAFSATRPEVDIVVERGSAQAALRALGRGAIDVAVMSRDLTVPEDQIGIRNVMIGRNATTIVVHPSNKIDTLSLDQLRGLLLGEKESWLDVGGPRAPVHVISRKDMPRPKQFLDEILLQGLDIVPTAREMDSDEALANEVASDPYAIGYLSIFSNQRYGGALKTLSINGVPPSYETIYSARYTLTESLYLVGKQTAGLADDFIRFASSANGQKIVAAHSLLTVR